jgi:NAD(P)-dependent dehydrogenase (short-subunit alcohol dehydrogenase family)
MTTGSVALILGYGSNIGAAVAKKFASSGFKVAITSRKGTDSKTDEGYLFLKADFTKPDSIPAVFDQVKKELLAAPAVVVYNAGAYTSPPDKESPFSISTNTFVSDLNVNTVSPYVAAQQAVQGWETLPKESKKTFIFTGNILNTVVLPPPGMMTLGTGKSASAYWIGVADQSKLIPGAR